MRAVVLFCVLVLSGEMAFGVEPAINVSVRQDGETFVVDATVEVQVSLETAWRVLTDFDHMASFLGNLTSSKVIAENANNLTVRQEGVARYGPLSFSFESVREIRLEPMQRILAKNLSGTLKRMESEAKITPLSQGVQIKYDARIVPDSVLARIFGISFVQHEVEEQFLGMAGEMLRRDAPARR